LHVTSIHNYNRLKTYNKQPMACEAQLAVQLYKNMMTYKASKLGQTDLFYGP